MSRERARQAYLADKITYAEYTECMEGKLVVTETYLWRWGPSGANPGKRIKHALRKLETPEERTTRRENEGLDKDINSLLGLPPPWRRQFGIEMRDNNHE